MVSDPRLLEEFDAAYPRLVAVAHRAIRKFFRYDPSKIEDALAETMARTFAHWDTVRGQESPHGWVVICAKDVCLEQVRADARHTTASATIWQHLDQLPRRQRSIAVLRYLMGFNEVATARALGTSVTSVEATAAKTSDQLRPVLVDYYADPVRSGR